MFPKNPEQIISDILYEKTKLESEGKNPTIVLLDSITLCYLQDWVVEFLKKEELKNIFGKVYFGEGILLGMLVLKVDTIRGFELK